MSEKYNCFLELAKQLMYKILSYPKFGYKTVHCMPCVKYYKQHVLNTHTPAPPAVVDIATETKNNDIKITCKVRSKETTYSNMHNVIIATRNKLLCP